MSPTWRPGRACSIPRASALFGDRDQAGGLGGHAPDRERTGGVGHPPVEDEADVDREDVAVLEADGPGNPVHDLVVQGGADGARERRDGRATGVAEERGNRAARADRLLRDAVDLEGRDALPHLGAQEVDALGERHARGGHGVELVRGLRNRPRGSARRAALGAHRPSAPSRREYTARRLTGAVDLAQHATVPVVVDHRRRLRRVRLESGRHRLGAVVVALVEVAAARHAGRLAHVLGSVRVEDLVIGAPARATQPPSAEPANQLVVGHQEREHRLERARRGRRASRRAPRPGRPCGESRRAGSRRPIRRAGRGSCRSPPRPARARPRP